MYDYMHSMMQTLNRVIILVAHLILVTLPRAPEQEIAVAGGVCVFDYDSDQPPVVR